MKTTVKFYKEDGNWYADIPNHTKEENEMVMGSDDALDFLSDGGDKIELTLSDEETFDFIVHFNRTEHDEDGAYYQACGNYDMLYPIWICNVTHDVFGEHPKDIYLLSFDKQ